MRSTTWYVTTEKLTGDPKWAPTLVRLIIAMNDVSTASYSIDQWADAKERKFQERKVGASLYFARMLLSHIYEALQIVAEISKDPSMRDDVEASDAGTFAAFVELEAFCDNKNEMLMLVRLRNNAGFHYDKKLPGRVLKELDVENPGHGSMMSLGHQALDCYFKVGDEVIDRLIVRKVLTPDMPRSAERRDLVMKISSKHQAIARLFTDFAGNFIRHRTR